MQNNKEDKKVKVETKRIRGRNLHDTLSQIIEKYNSSEGWALVKANQMGMGVDAYLERSEKQSNKVEANVKTEEKIVEENTSPEKQSEDKADDSGDSKPKTTTKRTTSRAKK